MQVGPQKLNVIGRFLHCVLFHHYISSHIIHEFDILDQIAKTRSIHCLSPRQIIQTEKHYFIAKSFVSWQSGNCHIFQCRANIVFK